MGIAAAPRGGDPHLPPHEVATRTAQGPRPPPRTGPARPGGVRRSLPGPSPWAAPRLHPRPAGPPDPHCCCAAPSSTCMRGIASAEPTLCPPVYSPRPHTYTQHRHPPRQSYKRTPADQYQHQHQHCHHHCCCTSVIHPSTRLSAHVFVHSDLVSQLTYVSGEYCTITTITPGINRINPNPNPNPTCMLPTSEKR